LAEAPASPSGTVRPDNLTGTWQITDTVTTGSNTGQSFRFLVALVDVDGAISGAGNGLTIAGRRTGEDAELQFVRVGSSGTFIWHFTPDGTLSGTFTDSGGNNSGASVAERR
jgi:hypothetical protein